jgi:superfamily II DNA or RNA helicase
VIQLYPHQADLVARTYAAWETVRGVLLQLSTGGGKTVIFSTIAHDHVGASLMVAHRKEIISQISLALAALGTKHRVVAPPKTIRRIRRRHLKKFGRSFVDPNAQCGVGSVQTITSRASEGKAELQRWLNQVTLAIFDEGHHYVDSGLWSRAIDSVPNAKLLFATATPERADGKGLGSYADGYADVMIEGPPTKWLIENGYLAPFRYYAPNTDLDVSGMAVTASGDFNAKAFRARVVDSHLVGDVVRHYRQFALGKKTIVFATDVETAEEIAETFRADGHRAIAVSGATEAGERDRIGDGFEGDEYDVLVNVDLFDEGYDVPKVECVLLARPTESLGKFLQMVGRALRILKGKTHAIIIDAVRNWERHGMPDWPRTWTLDAREKGTRNAPTDTVPQRVCKGCTQPYEAFYRACPHCGYVPEPEGRGSPEQVDGVLTELDVDALAALFDKMRVADMSDEEFQQQQIARHVPAIGQRAGLKRHQSAKYRRGVLRQLVAWWVGAQPGRDMDEIHSRFFYRFDIDIGLAFTLSAKETDALIEKISSRFGEDVLR